MSKGKIPEPPKPWTKKQMAKVAMALIIVVALVVGIGVLLAINMKISLQHLYPNLGEANAMTIGALIAAIIMAAILAMLVKLMFPTPKKAKP